MAIALILFGSISSIIGLLVLGHILSDMSRFTRSKKWSVVSGTVQSSRVEEVTYTGDDISASAYHPAIYYRYEVNGKEYIIHDRDAFKNCEGPIDSGRVVAEYPIGMKVNVFYNPKKPKESTLKTSFNKIPISDYLKTSIPLAVGALLFGLAFTLA